ncbi:MAG: hypothetical protein ACR2O4_01615 [Hyphomicrobiaceae bacterium]
MTKFLAAIALTFALSAGAVATSVPADAAPSYGLSAGGGYVNPFEAGVSGQ